LPNKIFTANAAGEVDYFNRQWTEFTGMAFDRIRDWASLEFIHPDDVGENIRSWKHSLATGEPFQVEHRLRGKDHCYRWHLSRAHAMRGAEGRVVMWIGSNTDIDDQKRAEKTLDALVSERTAKLEQTLGELEGFSYSITHDLRAPLRAMEGFSHLLLEGHAAHLDETGKDLLRRIATSASRMDLLIQDVLVYSRFLQKDLKLEPVNVEKLVRGMFETYFDFQEPEAEVTVTGVLPTVLGNEAALTQCFSNLLHNAVKFVTPGTKPRVRISAEEKGERVRFWIADNGIGIKPNYFKTIFGIFQRLGTTFAGTGIGLAIVRKAAEGMSGAVGVESEPGQGSRFWLELKLAGGPADNL